MVLLMALSLPSGALSFNKLQNLKKYMTTLKKGDKAPVFSGVDRSRGKTHKLGIMWGKISIFFIQKQVHTGCTAEAVT
jgi:hypothetical protein